RTGELKCRVHASVTQLLPGVIQNNFYSLHYVSSKNGRKKPLSRYPVVPSSVIPLFSLPYMPVMWCRQSMLTASVRAVV
ncbi:hypothetical protein ACK83A_004842, partial [Salmonella enterica]